MAGRVLYGAAFTIALPALLVWWAAATSTAVPLPVPDAPGAGLALAVAGLAMLVAGMAALIRHGKGLPMNAYPPRVYTDRGIYRWTSHPIYTGFTAICFGTSLFFASASGMWLVSPVVALGSAALVLGFERADLRRRFGTAAIHRPLVSLPPDRPDRARLRDRLSVYLMVGFPWVVAFESVCGFGIPAFAIAAPFPFERSWPVLEWTQVVYGSIYPFVLLTPFVVRTQRALRDIAVCALIATAGVILIYLTVPVISPPRPFVPQTVLGRGLMLERAMCHTVAAFPSFHVIWSLLAARAWATRSPAWGRAGWTWATLISITCVTTGMHALVDIAAGAAAFLLVVCYRSEWEAMRRGAERIANSWHQWRWRGVRVINYAAYPALAGAAGFWISNAVSGAELFPLLLIVYLFGLVGAGLWAQQLEGSPKLARPFGYFGGVLGAVAGVVAAGALSGETMRLFAAMAVAAPWIQAIGRFRCLVQGCCHGGEAPASIGIRYRAPRSRVATLAHLQGVPLHPTPLYSILGNIVIGALICRLWSLNANLGMIAGVYLILEGLARFVEEAYRGEPQTMVIAKLRLYQWMAMLSIGAGIALTTVADAQPLGASLGLDPPAVLAGLAYGLIAGLAMGVDFPASERRFARLAPP